MGNINFDRSARIKELNIEALAAAFETDESATASDYARFKRRLNLCRVKRRFSILQKTAAILLIPLALAFGWYVFFYEGKGQEALSVSEFCMTTPYGVVASLSLPDGTKVWANSGTSIGYQDGFGLQHRNLSVSGEAFFDVTRNEALPFTVTTPGQKKIKVLGTTFSVSCYPDDGFESISLFTGSLAVGETLTLHPLQKITYRKDGEVVLVDAIHEDNELAWKTETLYFDNTPIQEVFKRIERWYAYKINVKTPLAASVRLSARFKNESIVDIFEMIQESTHLRYSISDKIITVY